MNTRNFSMEDIVGVTGSSGSGRRGGRGGSSGGGRGSNGNNFMVGQQPGISKVNSFGLNYSNSFSKLDLSTSYLLYGFIEI